MKGTNQTVRMTVDLPLDLHAQICKRADDEKRSRHSEMLVALEKHFTETPNGKKEKSK